MSFQKRPIFQGGTMLESASVGRVDWSIIAYRRLTCRTDPADRELIDVESWNFRFGEMLFKVSEQMINIISMRCVILMAEIL